MKKMKILMMAVSLVGLIGFGTTANADDSTVSKDAFTPGSYCHMKFAPIDQGRSSAERPVLKNSNSGDLIDFYGPCEHDPLGKDEIKTQSSHLSWRRDYTD